MISKTHSITVNWLESTIVDVEVDINNWLPAFTIVWLPDQWVQESKERLRSAMKSSSTRLPQTRITVNLAPADIKKSGPSFDLPIAIWILRSEDWIKENKIIEDSIFLWELALDWKLRKIAWVLPAVIWAKEKWFKRVFLPEWNSLEASIIPWIDIIKVNNLKELIDILNSDKEMIVEEKISISLKNEIDSKYDFKYIIGQEHAKRALEIAAAWGHNIIMNGPPWSWKTMLAKAFSTILPTLIIDEVIEISKLYSISWLLTDDMPIVTSRPFRTIHHTASSISIIGWWRSAKPGEISLAHKWVLFLDEILEFNKSVLEVLRQPLEDWYITVTRVNASYRYPAKFTLVWAMNPCPCWYLTDDEKECKCSMNQIKNYSSKLSWPLIDRVDIFIEVPRVKTSKFKITDDYSDIESSSDIIDRVEKAKKIQVNRFSWLWISSNSEMSSEQINKYCKLSEESEKILSSAIKSMKLSARSYFRILKLSRTIADLASEENIDSKHILEALSFRKREEEGY